MHFLTIGRVLADIGIWMLWAAAWPLCLELPSPYNAGALLILTLAFYRRYISLNPQTDIARRAISSVRSPGRNAPLVALSIIPATMFGTFLDVTYRRLPFVSPVSGDYTDMFTGGPLKIALATLVMAVIGPVIEEFGFRGWIMGRLTPWMSHHLAIGLSALLFASAHLQPTWIPYFFALGVVLGYAVHLTGSIWSAVALHTAHNTTCLVLEPWFPDPDSLRRFSDQLGAGIWSAPILALCSLAALGHIAGRLRLSPAGIAPGAPGLCDPAPAIGSARS